MKLYLTKQNDNRVNNLLDPFEGFFHPFFNMNTVSNFMKTDVSEDGDSYKLDIEMPGFDKKDIALKFEDGYLTVSATFEQKEDDKFLRRERKNSMSRSYYVGDVDQNAFKAKYDKGILTVTFPKESQKIPASAIEIE